MYDTMFALSELGHSFHVHNNRLDFDEELRAMTDLAEFDNRSHAKHHAFLDNYTSVIELADDVKRLHLDHWVMRIHLWIKYGRAVLDRLSLAKAWYTHGSGFKLITAHQSKGLEFEHVMLSNDLRFDDPESANLFYVALTRATTSVYIPTNVINYVYSKRAHLCYPSPTMSIKLCSRCKRRSTNRRVIVECDSDVILNNTCEIHVCEPVCGACM
jgi:superfamily I DNA/RNA helicase